MRADPVSSVALRPVAASDCEAVFRLQTEPGARRFMHRPDAPTLAEHQAWFARRLREPGGLFAMIEVGHDVAGMVRCDPASDGAGAISVLVSDAYRGRGIATEALRQLRQALAGTKLVAEIHPDNAPSRRAFAAAGFVEVRPGRFEA